MGRSLGPGRLIASWYWCQHAMVSDLAGRPRGWRSLMVLCDELAALPESGEPGATSEASRL